MPGKSDSAKVAPLGSPSVSVGDSKLKSKPGNSVGKDFDASEGAVPTGKSSPGPKAVSNTDKDVVVDWKPFEGLGFEDVATSDLIDRQSPAVANNKPPGVKPKGKPGRKPGTKRADNPHWAKPSRKTKAKLAAAYAAMASGACSTAGINLVLENEYAGATSVLEEDEVVLAMTVQLSRKEAISGHDKEKSEICYHR